jgi:hypothetical protein
MINTNELLDSIENFLAALSYTYHVDKRELYEMTGAMCQARARCLAALDADRNR